MKSRNSSGANRPSAIFEFLRIMWNPKDHCRDNNRPPLVSILGQINPIRARLSYFFKAPFNIIPTTFNLSKRCVSSQLTWSLSMYYCFLPYNTHILSILPLWFEGPKNTCIVLYCGRVPAVNAPGCTAAECLLYKPWSLVVPACTARCLHQRP